MAMKLRTIFYLMGQGIGNLFKNRIMTMAAITTIAACIFVVSIFYVVGQNIEYMLDAIETNMGITIYFEDGTTQERIQEIQKLLEVRKDVHRVEYISPEQAWENFKNNLFKGHEEQLAGFEGDNPLKDSASLIVYYADLDSQDQLLTYINSLPDIRYIREAREVTDVMQSLNALVRYGSVALVTILVIISVFLISNTVRLGISTRQKEIQIMKYIGARDSFIKGPFIIEGLLIGAIGTAIPLGVIHYFYDQVTTDLLSRFSILQDYMTFMALADIYKELVPVAAAVGILIGLIGSRMTIHRYLKA